jgi:hypothetical protein
LLDGALNCTIEGWAYFGDQSGFANDIFWNKGNIGVRAYGSGGFWNIVFVVNGTPTVTPTTLPLSSWTYFVCSYASGVTNGVQIWTGTPGNLTLQVQATITGAIGSGGTYYVGAQGGSQPFAGSLMGLTVSNIAWIDPTQFPTVFTANGTPNGGQNKAGVVAAWPLQIGGIVPLYCDVYYEGSSTVSNTYVFDMANPGFKGGLYIGGLGQEMKMVQLNFRCSTLDELLEIDAIGIIYKLGRRVY